MIPSLTTETFKTHVFDAKGIVLVDFWAKWCRPCDKQHPILLNLKNKYPETLKLYKLEVDEEPEIAEQVNIMSMPTLIIFKDGVEHERLIGVHALEDIIIKLPL